MTPQTIQGVIITKDASYCPEQPGIPREYDRQPTHLAFSKAVKTNMGRKKKRASSRNGAGESVYAPSG